MEQIPERVIARLNSRIEVTPSGCWRFTGSKSEGYGRLSWSTPSGKIWRLTHRLMYAHIHGSIPEGLDIDHLCHDPKECHPAKPSECPHRACCNPAHLGAASRRENLLRGGTTSAERRAVTHCPQGHELTEQNTLVSKKNQRQCKACTYERNRAYYHANKERRAAYNKEWRERQAHQPG